MAWTSTTYSEKKNLRAATQKDTIGEVYTKTFTFTIPSGASNTDSIELSNCKVPAGTAVLGCYLQGSAANVANSAISLKFTTGGQVFTNAANNVTTVATAQTITAANAVATVDDTITVTQTGSANATGATTVTATLVLAGFGGTAAGLTTYTI